jgi:hypothetical protein
MGYRQALRAIDANRRIAAVDATEHRHNSSRPKPAFPLKVPRTIEKILRRVTLADVLTAAGTAIVALGILVLVGRSGEPPEHSMAAAPTQAETPAASSARPPENAGTEAEDVAGQPDDEPTQEPETAARGTIKLAQPEDSEGEPIDAAPESPAAGPPDDTAPEPSATAGTEPTTEAPEAGPVRAESVAEMLPEELAEMGITASAAAAWEAEAEAEAARAESLVSSAATAPPVEAETETETEDGPEAAEQSDLTDSRRPATAASRPVEVRRALIASDVLEGEPVEPLSEVLTLPPDGERLVYFFVELGDGAGEAVTHRWLNAGGIEEEQALQAPGDDGVRAYTARRISADRAGEWRVEALGSDGRLLAVLDFRVEIDEDAAAPATLAEDSTTN